MLLSNLPQLSESPNREGIHTPTSWEETSVWFQHQVTGWRYEHNTETDERRIGYYHDKEPQDYFLRKTDGTLYACCEQTSMLTSPHAIYQHLLFTWKQNSSKDVPHDYCMWQFGSGIKRIIQNKEDLGLRKMMRSAEGIPMSIELMVFLEHLCKGKEKELCEPFVTRNLHICDDQAIVDGSGLLKQVRLIQSAEDFKRLCQLTDGLLCPKSENCELVLKSEEDCLMMMNDDNNDDE